MRLGSKAILGLFFVLILSSCGGDNNDQAGISSTETSASAEDKPVSTDASGRELIEIPEEAKNDPHAMYLLFNEALLIAESPPEVEPNYQSLSDLATEELAGRIKDELVQVKKNKLVTIQPANSITKHRLGEIKGVFKTKWDPERSDFKQGDLVEFTDCYTNDLVEQDLNGEVKDDAVSTQFLKVEMLYSRGAWRVSYLGLMDKFKGETTCS